MHSVAAITKGRHSWTRALASIERRPWLLAALTTAVSALGFFFLFKFVLTFLITNAISICWPVNGLVSALLLRFNRRHWPWILTGFFLSDAYVERKEFVSELFVNSCCNLAEILITAFALPAFHNLSDWMRQPRLLTRFLLGPVLLGPAITSIPVAAYYALVYHRSFLENANRWGFGDLLGVLLWLPLGLILFSSETWFLFHRKQLPETIALLALLFGVSSLVFLTSLPLAFIILPLLLLIALRLGFSGSVIAVNMLTVITSIATLHGHGPFATIHIRMWMVITLQIFLSFSMLMCFPVSIVLFERRRLEESLKSALLSMELLAMKDGLTGLANRRRFDLVFEEEWRRAMREGQPLGLLLIDVDCFKLYNDNYGHLAGDDCLRRIAESIDLGAQRAGDLVARYGGEEFVILMPRTRVAGCLDVAESVRMHVLSMRLEHQRNPHAVVTISVGCCSLIPKPGMAPMTLIEATDQALYRAKQNGRNRIESLQPVTSSPASS